MKQIRHKKEEGQKKRHPLKIPRVLSKQQVNHLLNVMRYEAPLKDLIFIKCLYYLGLRISEAINLTEACFDSNFNQVYVVGKGGSKTFKTIPTIFKRELKRYIHHLGNKQKLFNFSRITGWHKVKKYCITAELPDWVTPHTFRHSYATELYRDTKDLVRVQKFLGHKEIGSTAIYTHIPDEEDREIIDRVFK